MDGHRARVLVALAVTILSLLITSSHAANDVFWDPNGVTAQPGAATAVTGAWNGSNVNWNDDANGAGTNTATTSSVNDLHFSAGTTYTSAGTITVTGTQFANSLIFEEATPTFNGGTLSLVSGISSISGVGSPVINSAVVLTGANTSFVYTTSGGTRSLNFGGSVTGTTNLTINALSNNSVVNINGGLNIAGSLTVNSNQGNGVTVNSALGSLIRSVNVNLASGTAVFTLNAVSQYTGPTNLTAGKIALGVNDAIHATSQLVLTGGTFDLLTFNQTSARVQASGGTIAGTTGVLTSTTAFDFRGSSTVTAILNGTAGLNKTGTAASVVTLSAANTFTGGINISGGTVLVSTTGTINGSNAVTFTGAGAFSRTGAAGGGDTVLPSINFSGGDGLVQSNYGGAGNTSLTISSFTRSAGAIAMFNTSGGANGTTNKVVLTGQATGFINPGVLFSTNEFAYYDAGGYVRALNYGAVDGAGVDPGTYLESTSSTTSMPANSYVRLTGAINGQVNNSVFTTINWAPSSAARGANFTLASGATVTFDTFLRTTATAVGQISGGTGIRASSNGEMIFVVENSAATLTINTSVLANGTNAFTKGGLGRLDLASSNNYTGVTTVSAGTLGLVTAGNNNIASSPAIHVTSMGTFDVAGVSGAGGFILAGGQTLKGAGTVNGNVTGVATSVISPGTTTNGILKVNGDVVLGAANFAINISKAVADDVVAVGVDYDQLSLTGSGSGSDGTSKVDLTGGNLVLTAGAGIQMGDAYFIVAQTGIDAVVGTFSHLNGVATTLNEGSKFTLGGVEYTITYQANWSGSDRTSSTAGGNDVALLVPEPAGLAFICLSCAGLLARRRSRAVLAA